MDLYGVGYSLLKDRPNCARINDVTAVHGKVSFVSSILITTSLHASFRTNSLMSWVHLFSLDFVAIESPVLLFPFL